MNQTHREGIPEMNQDTSQLQPGVSVDCVIFGFHENTLKVLILETLQSSHMLPGGFIPKNQSIDQAARHVLQLRSGLTEVFLNQFQCFGALERHQTKHFDELNALNLLPEDFLAWCKQRFITIGYYALVEYSKVTPTPDKFSKSCQWYPVTELPDLLLDHNEIVHQALASMRQSLNFKPIGLNLLPEEFTLSELQSLYETILDKKLDRRNFRRKIMGFGFIEDTGKRRFGGQHKAPSLYRFDKDKYEKANQMMSTGGW